MKCYHCAVIDYQPWKMTFQVAEAVGVCKQCGEAVCQKHAVKSDLPLPGTNAFAGRPALLPLLCVDCYAAIKVAAAQKV